jgi:hypothetical protein
MRRRGYYVATRPRFGGRNDQKDRHLEVHNVAL